MARYYFLVPRWQSDLIQDLLPRKARGSSGHFTQPKQATLEVESGDTLDNIKSRMDGPSSSIGEKFSPGNKFNNPEGLNDEGPVVHPHAVSSSKKPGSSFSSRCLAGASGGKHN